MNIHEYQAKEILRSFGVPVPAGRLCTSPTEAETIAKELGTPITVVKAQIHAGGRGKGGGVKVAKSPAEAGMYAEQILGMTLVTHQTGPEGKLVQKCYIEAGVDIVDELYVAILLDRASEKIGIIASTEGGMDIEKVAAETPEKILTELVDPNLGIQSYQCRKIGFALGLDIAQVRKLEKALRGLYQAFMEKDASLMEINPLVVTGDGDIIAADCKINFDDSALYRHPDVAALRDPTEEDPREQEAHGHDLSYVGLDGSIGCMVNGAGLAMATLDIIALYGGMPANFLDVGGTADKDRVVAAFKLILRDPGVKVILVNIFGGIVLCDLIAEGVVAAAREMELSIPLVVRLQGNNADIGKKILKESGLNITAADGLRDAAEKAVAAAKEAN
jgi:succinyl-CoA synthetase beta subunit